MDGETHAARGESRTPVVIENVETNVAVAIDVLVHRTRLFKDHDGGLCVFGGGDCSKEWIISEYFGRGIIVFES